MKVQRNEQGQVTAGHGSVNLVDRIWRERQAHASTPRETWIALSLLGELFPQR